MSDRQTVGLLLLTHLIAMCIGVTITAAVQKSPEPKIETKIIERVIHVPEPCHDPNTREGMIAKAKQAVKDLNRCTYVLQAWGYEVSTYDEKAVWCNDQRSFCHFPVELTIKEVK